MRLPKLAIENFQFVLVLVFLGLATGLLSYFNMPRSEDPSLDFPVYNVIAVYPGTSPEDLEDLVVDPIESALGEIEDLKQVNTTIEDGLAVIKIEGEFGVDTDEQYDEISASVNKVRSELPDDLQLLETRQASPQDVVIAQMALVSETASYHDLLKSAELLEDRLERIKGIRGVDIDGYPEEQVRINLDMQKMASLSLPLPQVLGIIQSNNANVPGGEVKAGTQSFSLKTSGGYESLEELKTTIVSSQGGKLVRLQDVAKVVPTYEEDAYFTRYNGRRAVFVSVTQLSSYNILQLGEQVEAEVAAFTPILSPDMELVAAFEQAPAVRNRVNDFFLNLLQGILLVGGVILIFLGVRNSLIIITVIPASILIAINLLDLSGFGLQQISIAGLVIALGLLVDNGIVLIENVHRFLKEGHSPVEAAVKGTGEVGYAIISSTITTVLAFFPLTQLGGGTGAFIKSMPIIVMFSLVASLLLALVLTPLLGARLLKPRVGDQLTRAEQSLRWLMTKAYRPVLNFSLNRPVIVVSLALLSLIGSGLLFPLVGVSFFPSADKPLFVINIDTPKGTHLDRTDEAARYVESVLAEVPFVSSYLSNIGHGNPQIYYNLIPKNYTPNHAQIVVQLDEYENDSFYGLLEELRTTFDQYAGATIRVVELKNGPPYEAPIAIKVLGDDPDELKRLAAEVEELIAGTEGTLNVDNPLAIGKTNLRAEIHREKAGMMGVQLLDIDLALRTALAGSDLGTLSQPDGTEYQMLARLGGSERTQISDFHRVSLPSQSGAQVPLPQLVRLKLEADAAKIDHFDLQRTATVTADVGEAYSSNELTRAIIDQLDGMDWPAGYEYYVGGEYETQQESFGDLGQLLAVAILGIFAVLILQFRSLAQPFIVISAIPLAFTGSIVALFLTGYSFSFLAFVGFTSLTGIVVNTSIILVDYANQLRDRGMDLRAALQQAAETRFSPILLTTLTTICGLLPLTLSGSNLWAPMGWAIIGGMVSSTLLTMLIVPILYQWLSKEKRDRFAA
ncbi:MAG: efflux RND transporter permease subunit [Bacteroidota bacterium]